MSILRDLVAVPGEEVVVELEDETFIGVLKSINHRRDIIRLVEVRDNEAGTVIDIPQDFFGSQIKSIVVLHSDQEEPKGVIPDQAVDADDAGGSAVADGEQSVYKFLDLNRINASIDEHVYVDRSGDMLQGITKYLHQQRHLAVATDGSEEQQPTLLLIASSEKIFIFDILRLDGQLEELRHLLANPAIYWVAHNPRCLDRVLEDLYDLKLGDRCFDTAYQPLAGTNNDGTLLTIEECLIRHLHIPGDTFDTTIIFPVSTRPLTLDQRRAVAKKVAFLLGLRDYYVHEKLLASFYKTCDRYGSSLMNLPTECECVAAISNTALIRAFEPFTVDSRFMLDEANS